MKTKGNPIQVVLPPTPVDDTLYWGKVNDNHGNEIWSADGPFANSEWRLSQTLRNGAIVWLEEHIRISNGYGTTWASLDGAKRYIDELHALMMRKIRGEYNQ